MLYKNNLHMLCFFASNVGLKDDISTYFHTSLAHSLVIIYHYCLLSCTSMIEVYCCLQVFERIDVHHLYNFGWS